jgi:hypothetical protein
MIRKKTSSGVTGKNNFEFGPPIQSMDTLNRVGFGQKIFFPDLRII